LSRILYPSGSSPDFIIAAYPNLVEYGCPLSPMLVKLAKFLLAGKIESKRIAYRTDLKAARYKVYRS